MHKLSLAVLKRWKFKGWNVCGTVLISFAAGSFSTIRKLLPGSTASHHDDANAGAIGADEPVQVASVSDRDPEMLWYFGSQGIKPGIRLTIVEQLPFRGAYRIIVRSSQEAILLSEPIASAIFVSL